MCMQAEEIQARLFALQDEKYRDFHASLIPTVDKNTVIGVRTPILRGLAKELKNTPLAAEFMTRLPHKFFEENNLHAFLIDSFTDFDTAMAQTELFLPYVDNWATCDQLSPKAFRKNLPELAAKCREWIASDRLYTVRFGMGMLMRYFLHENFSEEYPTLVAAVRMDEYYIRMMQAWYFATALAAQYERILPYLEQKTMETWTHNKAIQKAIESNRITQTQKDYLRTLKIKEK